MKKNYTAIIIFFLTFFGGKIFSQNIAINTDGSVGEAGVMLDVKGINPEATTATQTVYQIKSFDVNALKLRMILGTNATAASRYAALDVYDAGTSTYSNLIFVPSGGNVGIGTTSPAFQLHVYNSQNGGTYEFVENPNAGATAVAGLSAKSNAGNVAMQMGSTAYGAWAEFGTTGSGGLFYDVINAVGDHIWRTTASYTERMRITNAGNVGINQTVPTAKLEVDGASGSTIKIVDGNQAAGNVLVSDAAGQGKWSNPSILSTGCAPKSQIFTAGGTFAATAGTTVFVTMSGGGGGGGGGGNNTYGGGGGGGGGAEVYFYYPVAISTTETWTINIGAAGGAGALNTNGTAGGTTSITAPSGTILSAAGGALGVAGPNSPTFAMNGGNGGAGGGAGGAGTAGVGDYWNSTIWVNATPGGDASPLCNYSSGAGGGGAASTNSASVGAGGSVGPKVGGVATSGGTDGGGGGASMLGSGGRGAKSGTASAAGTGYGAGGGGGYGSNGAPSGTVGAAGSAGIVIIYYWQ